MFVFVFYLLKITIVQMYKRNAMNSIIKVSQFYIFVDKGAFENELQKYRYMLLSENCM